MKTFRVWLLKRKLFKRNLLLFLVISSIILSLTSCAREEKNKLFVFCNDALYSLSINDQMQIEKTKITDPVIEVDKGIITKFFCLGPEAPFFLPVPPFVSSDGRKMIIQCSIEKNRKESPLSCLESSPFYVMINTDGSGKRLLLPPKVKKDDGYEFRYWKPWLSVSEKKYYFEIIRTKFNEGGKQTENETQLWRANYDDSERENLLKEEGVFYYPEYYAYWEFGSIIESPDGENILFFFVNDPFFPYTEYLNLWLMNVNNREKKNLTEDIRKYLNDKEACILETLFSHDGKKIIAIVGYTDKGGIWSMNIDGSEKRNLIENIKDKENFWPYFLISSENKILFLKEINNGNEYEGPDLDIWIMNIDGTDIKNLTEEGVKCKSPIGNYEPFIPGYKFQNIPAPPPGFVKFSPDGKKIAFKGRENNEYSLWIMNSDGSEKIDIGKKIREKFSKELPKEDLPWLFMECWYPTFSPDGKYILFLLPNSKGWICKEENFENLRYDLWIVNQDGSEAKNLSEICNLDIVNDFRFYFFICFD